MRDQAGERKRFSRRARLAVSTLVQGSFDLLHLRLVQRAKRDCARVLLRLHQRFKPRNRDIYGALCPEPGKRTLRRGAPAALQGLPHTRHPRKERGFWLSVFEVLRPIECGSAHIVRAKVRRLQKLAREEAHRKRAVVQACKPVRFAGGDLLDPYNSAVGQAVLMLPIAMWGGCILWLRSLCRYDVPVRHRPIVEASK